LTNLRFPGQYLDAETALNQNWFRDYDSTIGRYIRSDPIEAGVNTYSYVGGNPISNFDPTGLYCMSAGGITTCSYPGGPMFNVPSPPSFPNYIGPNEWLYHQYDITRAIGCANPADVMNAFINNPTPGTPSPATPGGTPNNAPVPFASKNPVTSYLTTDMNTGNPLVVNITGPGSAFSSGYVARAVSNGIAHTYGEGDNWMQSPNISYLFAEIVWGWNMNHLIAQCRCEK
jgi:RHS repeat-associated protein